MSTSELISANHLARKAIIYIRQSSPHQVLTNQESLRLQYALQQRAQELGWRAEAIEVIDVDLGVTGRSTQGRDGFKDVVAQVTLGYVGIILSIEVQRLSRNCSDWYPLLDLCAYKHCLIADGDGIYDPGSANGRLLLGLKGQLSELELHTIQTRLTAGLLNKAERGELALSLPIGLVREPTDKVVKDPNREVQDRLALVFSTFLKLKSACKVVRYFNDHQLLLPRYDRFKDIVWKPPSVAAILEILKNPAYAGAFVYGRSRTTHDPSGRVHTQRLPMAEWKICVRDRYEAYLDWPTFEKIQAMLVDNYATYDRNQSRGVPRPGHALLHGLVYCAECGHKMVVQYKGGTRYLCNFLRQEYGVPVCQNLPGDPIDTAVVAAFFQALSPVELDAYAQAVATQRQAETRLQQAQQQQLERLRYEAALAQRQFQHVDPENRLVAAELERRWETALQALQAAEAEQLTQPCAVANLLPLPAELRDAFSALGQRLPDVWPQLSQQHKKAFLRCLIDKVVVHRASPDQLHLRIVWRGGATTSLDVPVAVGALAQLSAAQSMETRILALFHQGKTDDEIAQTLTAAGYRSPMRPRAVLPSTVRGIRLKHRLFQVRHQSHPRRIPGYLTLTQVATALDISPHWIYDRIHNGQIQIPKHPTFGLFLFPDDPYTFDRFRQFRQGRLKTLRFSEGYQDA
jgi:DNA invertase Pin-like site-specific DNA recombinase